MAQNKGTIPVKDRVKKKSRFFVYFWIITTLPISVLFLLVISQLFSDLPSIEDLKDPQYSASVLYANDGKTEIGRYWKVNRVVAKYDSISPFIHDALISTEDERFYNHSGIDVKAIGRAVFSAGSSGGASTITQQLAKQLFTLKNRQDREIKIQNGESYKPMFGKLGRIFTRIFEKLRENIISTRIEIYFTKEEIITMYLNQFDFLYNAVGITNACRTYFGKLPNAVTKEEAAMLVGMCKNPGLYNPHTFSVKNYKGISVRGLVSQELLEKALMQNLSMHSTPYKSEIRRMIMMTGGLGSITKYRTITSKAIISYFNAKRVLDPCTGWGGRMLGSLASSSDTYYVGCEPDPNTAKGLRNILIDEAIPKEVSARAIIIEKPAEIGLNEIEKMDKFDLILTSPPYFNLELYTAGEQSTNQYLTWDVWVEKWLKVVILKCLSCLKEDGGVSCWSVKNFKSDKKYPLADVTKKIHEDAGWELIKIVKMTGSARPGKAKELSEEPKKKKESEEETFCFRRKI